MFFRQSDGDSFAFDVVKSFVPSRSWHATRYAVEDGARATSHHKLDQVTVSVVGVMSDTPNRDAWEAAAPNRSQLARAWFESLEGEFVDIVHPQFGVFENCLLRLDGGRRGRLLATEMSVEFALVEVAQRRTTRLPAQVRVGDQAPREAEVEDEKVASQSRSWAKHLTDFAGVTSAGDGL